MRTVIITFTQEGMKRGKKGFHGDGWRSYNLLPQKMCG